MVKGFLEALDFVGYDPVEYPEDEEDTMSTMSEVESVITSDQNQALADSQPRSPEVHLSSQDTEPDFSTLMEEVMMEDFGSEPITPQAYKPSARKGLFSTPISQSTVEFSSVSTSSSTFGYYYQPQSTSTTPSKRQTSHQTSSTSEPTVLQNFIEPNLSHAYSINHSTTNPDSSHRLATPYPAPHDILLSSRKMYASNIAKITLLKAQGVSEEQRRLPWTVFEDDQVIKYMLEIKDDPKIPKTEARFAEIAKRMEVDGFEPRSKTSIKNMWCRIGRGRSGFDERKGVRRDPKFVVNEWKAKDDSPRKRKGKKGEIVKGKTLPGGGVHV